MKCGIDMAIPFMLPPRSHSGSRHGPGGAFLAQLVCLCAAVASPLTAIAQETPPPAERTLPDGGGSEAVDPAAAEHAQDSPPSDAGESQRPLEPDPQLKVTLDLSNPRAAIRTFLVAIQEAKGDHPERIDDAVKCLDISQLEGEDRDQAARSLALRLHAIIDRTGVKLEDIPAETELQETEYLFSLFEKGEDEAFAPEIKLWRDPEGQWLFTARTLASIPVLEKRAPEKPEEKAPESDVPVARRSPRATMATFLEAMNADPRDMDEAVACLDPTGQDPEAWNVRGKTLATKLKNVIDKIKLVVFTDIPETPDQPQFVWEARKTGNIVVGKIAEVGEEFKADWQFTPKVGEWRFTPQTLATLDALYREFEDTPIIAELREAGREEELTFGLRLQRAMPKWLREEFFHLQGWQWLALAALVPAGWFIKAVAATVATLLLGTWLRRRKIDIDRDKQRAALRSVGAAAAVLFWLLAIQHLDLPSGLFGVLFRATQLAFAMAAVWAGYRLVDVIGGYIAGNKDIRLTQFDEVLVPLLSKILRILVVLVVVLYVLHWMGQPLGTVLGALGIGGLALAFAAKDTLGNFFGSITVLFDRPFGIGDWIVIDDIEGTVERVGFRSTRVRTFYNSVVTIPNSRMVNTNVDNYGARRYRRIRVMISITYSTPPDKIDAFCEGIRELVRLHPYTRKDYYHIYFNQFAPSSLDILLYVFLEVPDWGTELRERHRLFVDIIRLANSLGVEFAFPTQTVWLERSRDGARVRGELAIKTGDPDSVGLDEAAKVFEEAYGASPAPRAPVVIESTPRSQRDQPARRNE